MSMRFYLFQFSSVAQSCLTLCNPILVSMPNVIVTSHQAFLTHEALANIAQTTLANLDAYFSGAPLENEICYRCLGTGGANKRDCPRRNGGRCPVSAISQG